MSAVDPSTLSQFSVILCPITIRGVTSKKLLVVIGHGAGRVICLKPTSQVDRYYSDQELLKGTLHYKTGQCRWFSKPTIIDPANQFEIKYDDLAGKCDVVGHLPPGAKKQLITAVNNSHTLNVRQQTDLLEILG